MKKVTYLSVGETKGKKRVWIEGNRLFSIGLAPGDKFTVDYNHESCSIGVKAADEGRTVSSKCENGRVVPIIDLNNNEVTRLFKDVKRVRVVFAPGKITISIHPDDLRSRERFDRLVAKLQTGAPLDVGCFAHGAGIMDAAFHEGLEKAGIQARLMFGVEIEEDYLECSLKNNKVWGDNAIAVQGPMEHVELNLVPRLDIIISGIPCTGASTAGRAKNKLKHAEEHDSAGALFWSFLNLFKIANPVVGIIENVPSYGNSASAAVLRACLKDWGYTVQEAVFAGNEYGALENRQRYFLVATTEGLAFDIDSVLPVRTKEATVREILEDIPLDSDAWKTYSYLFTKEKRDKEAGKGFRMQIVEPGSDSIPTIRKGYHKVGSTDPLIPHPVTKGLYRKFTAREHAAAKVIPFDLVSGYSETTQHEMLGQSVVYPMVSSLGQSLGPCLFSALNPVEPSQDLLDAVASQSLSDQGQQQLALGF